MIKAELVGNLLFCSVSDRGMYYSSKRRGEDGISAIIDFLLSNARLVLGVGGVAVLGIATLAVKKVWTHMGVLHCGIGLIITVHYCTQLSAKQCNTQHCLPSYMSSDDVLFSYDFLFMSTKPGRETWRHASALANE